MAASDGNHAAFSVLFRLKSKIKPATNKGRDDGLGPRSKDKQT